MWKAMLTTERYANPRSVSQTQTDEEVFRLALGTLLGAAVATSIAKKVVNATSNLVEAKKISKNNNPPVINNTYVYTPPPAPVYTPPPAPVYTPPPAAEPPKKMLIACEYCDGIIDLNSGVTSCPHCSAPIKYQQAYGARPSVRSKTPDAFSPSFRGYGFSFPCYKCGAMMHYTFVDIIRNPVSCQAVMSAGFSGHLGEVMCANCGTYLPHYESNLIKPR